MKAKKKAVKSVKKQIVKKPAAKPKAKKATPLAKASAKKPAKKVAAKKVIVNKTTIAKSPAKKSNGFSIKSAAEKFKSAFAKSPAVSKPALKNPLAVSKKPAVVVKAVPSAKPLPRASAPLKAAVLPMPKGLLTEDRIRRMSDKEYMNDTQLSFFRYRLLQMRNEVLARELDVKERLHQREVFADPADRATAEEEHWLDLRLRERESLLLRKIDDALRRISDREFGYCEKTGDPIGIPRLLARPTATVCVDVKGQDERIESQFRDR